MLKQITQDVFDSILKGTYGEFDGYIIGKDITFPKEVTHKVFTHCEFELPLTDIKFTNVKFKYVEFGLSSFTDCKFDRCEFYYCNLYNKFFTSCTLNATEFNFCDLNSSVICKCSMTDVSFICSTLYSSMFDNVEAKDVQFYTCEMDNCMSVNSNVVFPQHVPSSGSFIAWKKALIKEFYESKEIIIKLNIPEDAKRCSANHKCRANKVEVLGFETLDGEKLPDTTIAHSFWDSLFKYHTGTIEVSNFNDNPQVECGGGIHFFLHRDDAVNYVF